MTSMSLISPPIVWTENNKLNTDLKYFDAERYAMYDNILIILKI